MRVSQPAVQYDWTITPNNQYGCPGEVVRGAIVVALAILVASAVVSFRSVYEPDLGWHLAQGRENMSGRLVRTNVFSLTLPRLPSALHVVVVGHERVRRVACRRRCRDPGARRRHRCGRRCRSSIWRAACSRAFCRRCSSGSRVLRARAARDPAAAPRVVCGIAACSWLIQRSIATRSRQDRLCGRCRSSRCGATSTARCIFGVAARRALRGASSRGRRRSTRQDAVHALAIAAACAAALLVNPYGWGLLHYLYENASVPQLLSIAELRPAYLPTYRAFFAYAAIAVLLLLSLPRRSRCGRSPRPARSRRSGSVICGSRRSHLLRDGADGRRAAHGLAARGLDGRAMFATALAAAVFLVARAA